MALSKSEFMAEAEILTSAGERVSDRGHYFHANIPEQSVRCRRVLHVSISLPLFQHAPQPIADSSVILHSVTTEVPPVPYTVSRASLKRVG
ncbi:hypothetical protein Pmani_026957 [Petrolisthes manimaculis]|uniref:Uncharacterized protein n=1 Tax=Petrolisthes manimaculis TaxID=1843537 RepID=A0AAE1P369_9EUCA|nr:hypothetical protein Pmani_026957 [Petrolisthes manimaculis]